MLSPIYKLPYSILSSIYKPPFLSTCQDEHKVQKNVEERRTVESKTRKRDKATLDPSTYCGLDVGPGHRS